MSPRIIASIVAGVILIAGAAYITRPVKNTRPPDASGETGSIGQPGSAHVHATFTVFINDEPLEFQEPEYMLKAPEVHLEDDDGTVIHSHATGITLPYFFQTLGYRLEENCFVTDGNLRYCSGDEKKLTLILNGLEYPGLNHVLAPGDRILINYGDDDATSLKIKFNSVPDLPEEL